MMMCTKDKIHTAEDMERQVLALGFLPFFRCGIPGFSIEERTATEQRSRHDMYGYEE